MVKRINNISLLISVLLFGSIVSVYPKNEIWDTFSVFRFGPNDRKEQLEELKRAIQKYKDKKQLLKDINDSNELGWTPLMDAVRTHDVEIVRCMLNNGALNSLNRMGKYEGSPLHQVFTINAYPNEWEELKLLLTRGAIASINQPYRDGRTLLADVIEKNLDVIDAKRLKIVKLLLYLGADANTNAVNKAVKKQKIAMRELLFNMRYGIEISDEDIYEMQQNLKTLVILISDPTKLKDYCTEEELKEFKEIKDAGTEVFEEDKEFKPFDIKLYNN